MSSSCAQCLCLCVCLCVCVCACVCVCVPVSVCVGVCAQVWNNKGLLDKMHRQLTTKEITAVFPAHPSPPRALVPGAVHRCVVLHARELTTHAVATRSAPLGPSPRSTSRGVATGARARQSSAASPPSYLGIEHSR